MVFSQIQDVYLQVHQSILLNRQVGDTETLWLQDPTWVQDTLVLRLCGDHMAFLGLVEAGDALEAG